MNYAWWTFELFKNTLPSDGLLLLRKGPAASLLFEPEKKITIKGWETIFGAHVEQPQRLNRITKLRRKKNGRMTRQL